MAAGVEAEADVVVDWDLDPFDASVTVPVNAVVRWVWDTAEAVTVTSGERNTPLAGLLFQSQRTLAGSFAVRFLQPGIYPYHDEAHFWNMATVTVVGAFYSRQGQGLVKAHHVKDIYQQWLGP